MDRINTRVAITIIPLIAIKASPEIESNREQPRVSVHSHQRQPVPPLHPIPCKIDPQRRLGKLWRNFLRRQRHFPRLIRVSVQTQVLLLYRYKITTPTKQKPNSNPNQSKQYINTTSYVPKCKSTTNRRAIFYSKNKVFPLQDFSEFLNTK